MNLTLIYIITVVIGYCGIEIGSACCDPADRRDTTIFIRLKTLALVMTVGAMVCLLGGVLAKEAFDIPIYFKLEM